MCCLHIICFKHYEEYHCFSAAALKASMASCLLGSTVQNPKILVNMMTQLLISVPLSNDQLVGYYVFLQLQKLVPPLDKTNILQGIKDFSVTLCCKGSY